ncbi:MAG TPA: HAD-IA family hydrolase [Usitatibacter sp.]|nr:HAD-IA family hydrolase [Usitatibacter sp.]
MIQAIFFDFDGVLTPDRTGTLTTCRYLSEQTGLPIEALRAAMEPYRAALARGQVTREETWPGVCRALKRDIPPEMLTRAFESTPLDRTMFALANSLGRRTKVGIITDNPKDRMDVVRATLWLDRVFAPIVVSAEQGMAKDDPAIFRHAQVAVGAPAADCVFIDNVQENVEAARSAGMHGLFFDDEKRDVPLLARELLALGVG